MTERKPVPQYLRRLVNQWHDHRCAHCHTDLRGKPRAARHIHHRDHDPANNHPANLQPLCLYCHIAQHPGNEQAMMEWALRNDAL